MVWGLWLADSCSGCVVSVCVVPLGAHTGLVHGPLYLQGSVHHPPASPSQLLKASCGEVYSLSFILCVPSFECPSPFFSWLLALQESPHILPETFAGPFFSRMGSDPYLLTSGLLP